MPKLILKFEAAVLKEFPVISSTVTIGRDADNDVPIDHPAISRHHARIILQGDTYFVEDLNSTNGTTVNEKKIIKAGIHHQDNIGIAKHTIVFIDERPVSADQVAKAFEQDAQGAPPPENEPPAEVELRPLPSKKLDKDGGLRIVEGIVDQIDFTLKESSTYIGKSDRATIKIKGGFTAPEVAAMVSKKLDGFYLVAIKDGYPKVNGMPLQGERLLNEGDMIEIGGTKMQFYLKNS